MHPDGSNPESTIPPGARYNMVYQTNAAGGQDHIKVENTNNDTRVSFKFSNAPLPMVLGPLANFRMLQVGQSAALAAKLMDRQGMEEVATAMAGKAEGMAKQVLEFRQMPSGSAGGAGLPVSPQLDLQVDAARTRQVTVSGNDMSLSDALDAIGKAPRALYDGSWTEWGGRPDLPVTTKD